MITVRFPNGDAIQYHKVNCARVMNGGIALFRSAESKCTTFIPLSAGAVIEMESAFRVIPAVQPGEVADVMSKLHSTQRQLALVKDAQANSERSCDTLREHISQLERALEMEMKKEK